MVIHLPEDLERSIRAEVQGGHFASVDAAIAEAWRSFLRERQPGPATTPTDEPSAGQELQRRLVEAGLLGEIKPPVTDLAPYRGRTAVTIRGEALSETVIRERR